MSRYCIPKSLPLLSDSVALSGVVLSLSLVLGGFGTACAAGPQDEITPTQYAALHSLKRMAPDLFKEKCLPLVNKAMSDGKITTEELTTIEAAAGSVSKEFHRAVTAESMEDTVKRVLKDAESKGVDITDSLNKALESGELSKMFDGAVDKFRDSFSAPSPQKAPAAGADAAVEL